MKIAVAQTRPVKGVIEANVKNHKKFIEKAISLGADLICFPELSLTGYEPTIASAMKTDLYDPRLNIFQELSDLHQIVIAAGLPLEHQAGVSISLAIFQPGRPVISYSKKYLHEDELPYFISVGSEPVLIVRNVKVALAICYEISRDEHAAKAIAEKAQVYLASVAKFSSGIETALTRLPSIARKHGIPVLMANSIGESDGQVCAGRSSVWDSSGNLLTEIDSNVQGLICYDTITGTAAVSIVS